MENNGLGHNIKNIGIISTRIAGTDGVSLEIEKWVHCLERNGFECFYMAGETDRPSEKSFVVEELHFNHPEIKQVNNEVFGKVIRPPLIAELIHRLRPHIKAKIKEFINLYDIDLIIPENILAIPMNIPLGMAITEFIAETGIPTIAHHHDFSWERKRFLVNSVQDYLLMAFPPDLPSIRHVVINSQGSIQLSHRRGISNTIIPNVYDFANPPPEPDGYARKLRRVACLEEDDIFILQPTRIVARKGIEKAIEIVASLGLKNPTLVLSHAAGDEGDEYVSKIIQYAAKNKVRLVDIEPIVNMSRGVNEAGQRLYTMADVYQCADFITYPSSFEGFGNAFLEAIYYRKTIVVNRYSIYVTDIEPKGFNVIVMDEVVTREVINELHDILKNKEKRDRITQFNYGLGKRYFSYEVAEQKILSLINTFKE
ncbi:MAG: glycosyltransferase family 4 protein [Deltaproteobacteria bacterium]|nr:glycosyltransferase family 4 protein [Deltaproteobacteria bacterium]